MNLEECIKLLSRSDTHFPRIDPALNPRLLEKLQEDIPETLFKNIISAMIQSKFLIPNNVLRRLFEDALEGRQHLKILELCNYLGSLRIDGFCDLLKRSFLLFGDSWQNALIITIIVKMKCKNCESFIKKLAEDKSINPWVNLAALKALNEVCPGCGSGKIKTYEKDKFTIRICNRCGSYIDGKHCGGLRWDYIYKTMLRCEVCGKTINISELNGS